MNVTPQVVAQGLILSESLAMLTLLLVRCARRRGECWRDTLPSFVWLAHCALYYFFVLLDRVTEFNSPLDLQWWSVALRFHSLFVVSYYAWIK